MNETIKVSLRRIGSNENTLVLGKQGECGARSLTFDCSAWIAEFGEGDLTLLVRRAEEGNAYPVLLTRMGGEGEWLISSADTALAGRGAAELRYTVEGKIVKSETFATLVYPSIGDTTEPAPDPYESWIETLVTLGETTGVNADRAEAAVLKYPYLKEDDCHWMIWDAADGVFVDSGICAQGEKGRDGRDGTNGQNGKDGTDGRDGVDGHTPVRGTDYWTAADQQQIVADVLSALPAYEGGSY